MDRHAQVHATAICLEGAAVLITGASGTGKSTLGWQLLGLGGQLIADDRVDLRRDGDEVFAARPETLPRQLEARGVGLITLATHDDAAPVRLVVDMDHLERERLPEQRLVEVLGVPVPLLHKVAQPYFPLAIHAYLREKSEQWNDTCPT